MRAGVARPHHEKRAFGDIDVNVTGGYAPTSTAAGARLIASSRTRRPLRRVLPRYFPNSYKYSTNDITAPSNPCTFGLADSMT